MMPRTPYATHVYDTPQKSARVPANSVGYVVVHHTAGGTFAGVIDLEMGARQVSSTVIIQDDLCASMMDEGHRAWSLSSQYWDSVSLSSETVNSGGAADGWPISGASYTTLAKVIADWCTRYGIPATRERIIGHREVYTRYGASYATACPGGIDLDYLVGLVQALLSPAPTRRKNDMTQLYMNGSTLSSDGNRNKNTVMARAGGSPGTSANWIEYTSGSKLGASNDPAALDYQAHGPHQTLNSDEWEKMKARFLEPVKVAGGTPSGGSGAAPTAEENASAVAAKLAPSFAKLPGDTAIAVNSKLKEAGN